MIEKLKFYLWHKPYTKLYAYLAKRKEMKHPYAIGKVIQHPEHGEGVIAGRLLIRSQDGSETLEGLYLKFGNKIRADAWPCNLKDLSENRPVYNIFGDLFK